MLLLRARLYPVLLLSANTATAFGLYVLTSPPIALLLGAVTLLLLAGMIKSQYDATTPGIRKAVK